MWAASKEVEKEKETIPGMNILYDMTGGLCRKRRWRGMLIFYTTVTINSHRIA